MKPIIPGLLFLCFMLSTGKGSSQPGGGGGLQIMKVYAPDGNLISKNDTALKIRFFMLSGKETSKIKKEFTDTDRDLGYNYVDEAYTHIYLPPHIRKKAKHIKTPDQRLQLIYNNDTMTIDLVGIRAENAGGNTDRMEKVEFTPGYFKCYRDPQKSSPIFWKELTQKQQQELYSLLRQGLDIYTIYQLSNYGLLVYIPPAGESLPVGRQDQKPGISERVDCIDTINTENGYMKLCPHNIQTKDSIINLIIKTPPAKPDSIGCYKFLYYFVFSSRQIVNNAYKQAYALISRITTERLSINNKPFSGCLKIAVLISDRGLSSQYAGYDLMVLYYHEGKITQQNVLRDVDLIREQILERPTGL